MIDKKLIERKLRRIEKLLKELSQVQVVTFGDFKKNIIIKRFIERNIQLAIEQMSDICKHLVSGLDLGEPETYAECFDFLAGHAIVTRKKAATFKEMVRFRNLLIHAYEGVDDTVVYAIYKRKLKDFTAFVSAIRAYLKKS